MCNKTKTARRRVRKPFNRKGFTLVELMVVFAILALLIAIAIPTFTQQIEKAREEVDRANERIALSLAEADWMLNRDDRIKEDNVTLSPNKSSYYYYTFQQKGSNSMEICMDPVYRGPTATMPTSHNSGMGGMNAVMAHSARNGTINALVVRITINVNDSMGLDETFEVGWSEAGQSAALAFTPTNAAGDSAGSNP